MRTFQSSSCGTILVIAILIVSALTSAAPAAGPSFDCQGAATARELATCADPRLAAADRELDAAWKSAIAHLDPATAKVLRGDQTKFLEDINNGFEGEVWGKKGPPEDDKELRAEIAQLRRGGKYDVLAALEAQLRERAGFLRNLAPATSYAGLWKNHDTEFLLTAGDNGHYRGTFGTTTFGWTRYHCHFTADFGPTAKGLAAAGAHNTDPEVDTNTVSTLHVVRSGAMLTLSEEFPVSARDADLPRICPRGGDVEDPLFHTKLGPSDARRLKP
jgi:hypothetical protein